MKRIATVFLAAMVCGGPAYAMTRVETPGMGTGAASATQSQMQQSGKIEAIHAGASKLVIGGVTYAYNPLTTVVTVNSKRSTISDVRVGETVRFQAAPQGAHQPDLLTTLSVQRR